MPAGQFSEAIQGTIMKKLLLGSAMLAALVAGPALAADMPVKARPLPPPVWSWTGFYVGGNVGYAWAHSDATASVDCPATVPPGWVCALNLPESLPNIPALNAAGSGSLDPRGFTGGIQAGYNLQTGNTVFGVEVDFGALRLNASRSGEGDRQAVIEVTG
jgi:outer membrane immunogenic protein